ncbi:hypothetical protein [Megalodesulfovibrio gigas]|uniref:hypothetical protein n=1 Tax=Megalodesulfovibrio gigas TaxID=879 RepID=UPI00042A6998|nr:hypothetical protein [Megalodesulfovibrio gigas]
MRRVLLVVVCLLLVPASAPAGTDAAPRKTAQDRYERAESLERCMRFSGPSVWFTGASCPRDTVEALCRHMQSAEIPPGDCETACRQRRQDARTRLAATANSGQGCLPWLDFAHAQCRQGCGE